MGCIPGVPDVDPEHVAPAIESATGNKKVTGFKTAFDKNMKLIAAEQKKKKNQEVMWKGHKIPAGDEHAAQAAAAAEALPAETKQQIVDDSYTHIQSSIEDPIEAEMGKELARKAAKSMIEKAIDETTHAVVQQAAEAAKK
eukprot:gnl/Hemi2/14302_TR4851_c0_g1_i1.p1 gnl/Hemi2/14302_TR4851_c0_g1~~gnl/Hemi2/14302_TR4851_c0_g1_i1.p1  ORF type:complete len:141 (-),score=62.30 gnl/Hemi2/14302_TR4851_c0_g1_i1:98-520(-)